MDNELEIYFPSYFGSDIGYIDKLREMYLYRIEKALGIKGADKSLGAVYEYFLEVNKPKVFNPFDERSVLINSEKEFEEVCYSMEESGVTDVKESTVFEFYSKLQYLERKAQKIKSKA